MIKLIKNIPVYALSTFGHCGVDWLHSHIASHKEVLTLPAISIFRRIDYLKKRKIKFNNIFDSEIIEFVAFLKKNFLLKKNQNKLIFLKYVKDFFVVEKKLNAEKKLFFSIHYAYAKINRINLDKIKVIVSQEHVPWNCYSYIKHFNSKFIFIIRDPRATIAGSLRKRQNKKKNFPFDMCSSFMLWAYLFCNEIKKRKILILKNENLNTELKPEMKKLAKWLKIKYNKTLLRSNKPDIHLLSESQYLPKHFFKNKLSPNFMKNYYKTSNSERRWRGSLNKYSILIIETVCERVMNKFNYKMDNKLNIFSRISGYSGAIFKFQKYSNFFPFVKLIFFKHILRRIFIIFFTKQSRKFFDIQ